jgi:hypothetical protein
MPIRRNKFNNKRTEYNGNMYDSKREADYAQNLDWRKKAREILKWERQESIQLIVNGVLVTTYRVDFVVTLANGVKEYHEVKGMITPEAKIKMKLFEALNPAHKLVVVK